MNSKRHFDSTLAVGYGGEAHSSKSEDSPTVLQNQKAQYKASLDDLQKPLSDIIRPLQISHSVLERAKHDANDVTDAGTLERELEYMKELTMSLAMTEAYLNKYIFTPLAESPEKLEDTIEFHRYMLSNEIDFCTSGIARAFSDFFELTIPATYEFPEFVYAAPAPTDSPLTTATTVEAILSDLKLRFEAGEQAKKEKPRPATSADRPRGVSQLYRLREAVNALKSSETVSSDATVQKLISEVEDLEIAVLGRKPSQPDKTRILWGRIVDILDNSGGKKIALKLNDILEAASAYIMYSLASGMISTDITDAAAEQGHVPVCMPRGTDLPLEFVPRSSMITEVTQATSTGSDGSAGRTSHDSPVLNGLIEAGARIYAINQILNKYLIVVRTRKGDNRICIVTTRPDNSRITLGHVPESLHDAAKQVSRLSRGESLPDSDTSTDGHKPVYIPEPNGVPISGSFDSYSTMGSRNADTTQSPDEGTIGTTLFNDRIMLLNDQLKSSPASSPRSRRIVVISGGKRDARIEFVRA